jgi:hypothetical protein
MDDVTASSLRWTAQICVGVFKVDLPDLLSTGMSISRLPMPRSLPRVSTNGRSRSFPLFRDLKCPDFLDLETPISECRYPDGYASHRDFTSAYESLTPMQLLTDPMAVGYLDQDPTVQISSSAHTPETKL